MYLRTDELPSISRDAALHPTDTVDTHGAAKILGLSASTLSKLRAFQPHKSPRFLKLGRRVLYRVGDLREWQEQRLAGGAPSEPNGNPRVMASKKGKE